MGWEDDHLHEFTIKKVNYGPPQGSGMWPMLQFASSAAEDADVLEAVIVDEDEEEDIDEGEDDGEDEYGTINENKVKLNSVVTRVRTKLRYLYDFGDSWRHEVEVEKILPAEQGVQYPICIAGERACPPEDIGGVWGYAHLLEVLADPNHPDRADMADWLGDWDDDEDWDEDEDEEGDEESEDGEKDGQADEADTGEEEGQVDADNPTAEEGNSAISTIGFDPDAFDIEAVNRRLVRVA